MKKLIITAAITGAELDKAKCPALPITPEEQADEAKRCVEAGASVIHLHVRDEKGNPSQELKCFKSTVDAIRSKCQGNQPIIQFSTGGAVGELMDKRLAPLTLKPEMASFNLGSINFGEELFVNSFADMRQLASALRQQKIVPEFEIYDAGHVDNLKKLIQEKIVSAPYHCQFVLGVPGALSGSIDNLLFLARSLPADSTWGVAGVGRYELPLAVHAMLMGGNIRVGLEDNIYYAKGQLADSNAQLVMRIQRLALELGIEVASAAEAKQILGV